MQEWLSRHDRITKVNLEPHVRDRLLHIASGALSILEERKRIGRGFTPYMYFDPFFTPDDTAWSFRYSPRDQTAGFDVVRAHFFFLFCEKRADNVLTTTYIERGNNAMITVDFSTENNQLEIKDLAFGEDPDAMPIVGNTQKVLFGRFLDDFGDIVDRAGMYTIPLYNGALLLKENDAAEIGRVLNEQFFNRKNTPGKFFSKDSNNGHIFTAEIPGKQESFVMQFSPIGQTVADLRWKMITLSVQKAVGQDRIPRLYPYVQLVYFKPGLMCPRQFIRLSHHISPVLEYGFSLENPLASEGENNGQKLEKWEMIYPYTKEGTEIISLDPNDKPSVKQAIKSADSIRDMVLLLGLCHQEGQVSFEQERAHMQRWPFRRHMFGRK